MHAQPDASAGLRRPFPLTSSRTIPFAFSTTSTVCYCVWDRRRLAPWRATAAF